MTATDRLRGCIIGGAIGDAWGSGYENVSSKHNTSTFYLGGIKQVEPVWSLTDDTQLTLITLEALLQKETVTPDVLAEAFVRYYRKRKITGLGASSLKALQELEAGIHWTQAGRTGEYAAGNGAAMRIAPVAFWNDYTREDIRDFCRITHRNEEAYVGALAIVVVIREILSGKWNGGGDLIELIVPQLPDTNLRDTLIELQKLAPSNTISDAAKLGTSGYVVHSVPFAIFCASQVETIGMETMYQEIIEAGGDTDTNASLAGQIAGTLLGEENIPSALKEKLEMVNGFGWVRDVLNDAQEYLPKTEQWTKR